MIIQTAKTFISMDKRIGTNNGFLQKRLRKITEHHCLFGVAGPANVCNITSYLTCVNEYTGNHVIIVLPVVISDLSIYK